MSKRGAVGSTFTTKNRRALTWLVIGLVVLGGVFGVSKLLTKQAKIVASPLVAGSNLAIHPGTATVTVTHHILTGPTPNYTRNPFAVPGP